MQRIIITRENLSELTTKISATYDIVQAQLGEIILDLDSNVLVPHPSDLSMIKIATEIIEKDNTINTVADVGTGSGILGIAIAKIFPLKTIYGSDINDAILKVARHNANLNGSPNIIFLKNSDLIWLSEFTDQKIDLIISNPPFVSDNEFQSEEYKSKFPHIKHQSDHAIRSFDLTGVRPYKDIIVNSARLGTNKFLFRINPINLEAIIETVNSLNCEYEVIEDKGIKRFIIVKRLST